MKTHPSASLHPAPPALALGAVLLLAAHPLAAQQFELIDGTVNNMWVNTNAGVTRNVPSGDPCDPLRPGPFVTDSASSLTTPPMPGFLQNIPRLSAPGQSWDLFYQHNLTASARGFRRLSGLNWCDCFIFSGSPHRTTAQGMAFLGASVEGGGNSLFTQWRNVTWTGTFNTDHSGRGTAQAINSFSLNFRVTGPQAGTPVTVYYRYNTSALGWTRHESGAEDPIDLQLGTLSLAGNSLIPSGMNPNSHAAYNVDGQVSLEAGQEYSLDFSARTSARIAALNRPSGGFCIDKFKDSAWAQFMGLITLRFSPPVSPMPGSPEAAACDYDLVYSVDIGSASEMSAGTGGVLDPGDIYPQGYQAGMLASYYRNDADWFGGSDPHPDPMDPASAAPVGLNAPIDSARDAFFNVNGVAFLPFDLRILPIGPGQPALTYTELTDLGFNVSCVLPPNYLLISYSDSQVGTYPQPYGAAPSNSIGINGPRGMSNRKDEILQLELLPYGGGAPSRIEPQFSETDLDPDLGPNPDLGVEENNDVNALAAIRDTAEFAGCADFTYITVSSDARFGLDPGTVYVPDFGSTGALDPVITPGHLGLPSGTDLNALEFTWLPDPETGEITLALLFSVARNFPETPEDETGGLAPQQVYASFLNGTHFDFGNIQGDTDINALALIPCRTGSEPAIVTSTLPPARVCSHYLQDLEAAGGFGGVFTWAITGGALPAGIDLDPSSGLLSGTPMSTGNYQFDVTVESPGFGAATTTLALEVQAAAPVEIDVSTPLANATLGNWYSGLVTALNGCDPSLFRISSGQLPDGLLLDAVSGLISGIPTQVGLFNFDVTVRDNTGNEATEEGMSIEVFGPAPATLALDPRVFPTVDEGDTVTLTLGATGGTAPYTFFAAGPLPPGYTLTGNTLEGTASGAGSLVAIDIGISDSVFRSGQDTLFFLIDGGPPGGPQISLPPSLDWTVGQPVQVVPSVTGGTPPYTFQWAHGQPPSGLVLDPATGTLSGTPAYPTSGIAPWKVTDNGGLEAHALVPFTIWAGFPGGYPAWKTFHGVVDDDENTDGDDYKAMVEYVFGTDPNLHDPPGLFRLVPGPVGTWMVDHPSAGVPDVQATLQKYDAAAGQWVPMQSNPFDPSVSRSGMFRLRTEYTPSP